ncbi:MAG: SDR family NAD(P)-dependent oxidoreductase, partial [Deltaproteobacteria bacterium]|nr:SDR family NAD(P)-dependent oxidoreductase [Deltaproteobacteria bacterium]
ADKTGYPIDMLELDLDLEADLGIDTVKQAETFAELRERFQIPKEDDLKLKDYPTLKHIVDFVMDKSAMFQGSNKTKETKYIESRPGDGEDVKTVEDNETIGQDDEWIIRRVPVPRPRLETKFFRSTLIDINGSNIVIAKDDTGIWKELAGLLAERNANIMYLEDKLDEKKMEDTVRSWMDQGKEINGVYWLRGLGQEPNLFDMEPKQWDDLVMSRVKSMHRLMKQLYDQAAGKGFFLISGTRTGGLHGYGEAGSLSSIAGGISGFTKAFSKERPNSLCKVVDFEFQADPMSVARNLVEETLKDKDVMEVGYFNDMRWSIELDQQTLASSNQELHLGKETIFLVTGAAGGITSEIVADLAMHSKGIFYLLDKVDEPDPNDPHLQMLEKDRDGLRHILFEEMKTKKERPTPKMIEQKIFGLEREMAALKAIKSVQDSGGKAYFKSVDLLDYSSVASAVKEIKEKSGKVEVIIHAAGVEISRALSEKSSREFDLVLDVKTKGLFNLLKLTRDMGIEAVAVFSSVAGRFGNVGQTDYSAANDLMCKTLSALRRSRPSVSSVAIDWTAWAGIGMASRGSLPRLLEQAGIDLLPPMVGIPQVRKELEAGGSKEVVIARGLGEMLARRDLLGGLDPDLTADYFRKEAGPFLAASEIIGAKCTDEGLEIEFVLDPAMQPFLKDHQVEDGVPYLPGVVGMECLAELSVLLLGGKAARVRNLNFSRPLKFHRKESKRLLIKAKPVFEKGEPVVRAELFSIHKPKKLQVPEKQQLHFTAEFLQQKEEAEKGQKVPKLSGRSKIVGRDQIYKTYFHGPSFQVLEEVKLQKSKAVGSLAREIPPEVNGGGGTRPLLYPRLVELCFQTAGLWEMQEKQLLCLPQRVESASVLDVPPQDEALYALVEARDGDECFDARIVDDSGKVYVDIHGYHTIAIEPTS